VPPAISVKTVSSFGGTPNLELNGFLKDKSAALADREFEPPTSRINKDLNGEDLEQKQFTENTENKKSVAAVMAATPEKSYV
jgi:hypothetical protein